MAVCVCMEYMGKVDAITLADILYFMHFEIKSFAHYWKDLVWKLFRTPTILDNEGPHYLMLDLQAHTKKNCRKRHKA